MAQNILGTNIASPIAPFTTDDKYPTHHAEFGKGGYRSVPDLSARDSIPIERLEDGSVVYVRSTDKDYRYNALTESWDEIQNGGAGTTYQLFDKEAFEKLRAADCVEGVLYLGIEEAIDTEGAWHFGEKFPIRLT